MSLNSEIEERFIAQKPRDAEEYLDCAGRRVRRSERGRRSRPALLGTTRLGRVAKETKSKMRHFVFGFCAALVLAFGPVRVASAQHWWRQSGPGPKGAGADQRAESPNQHTGKAQLERPTPLYNSPKSVGWWYKTPAPMGVGADTKFYFYSKWTRPHFRREQGEKLTPLYTSPKSVGWWHKTPAPMGAGAGK